MKKMLDKPYKLGLYFIMLLLLGMTTFKSDVSLYRITNVPEISVTTTKEVAIVEPPKKEVAVVEPQVKETTPKTLSRGGSMIKPVSEREVINSYVREIAPRYNIEPEFVMSIIVSESDYNPKATTGKCLGLMQVSKRWHSDRAKRLGVTNFYDPYSNILIGVDYLSELFKEYKDPRLVLMMYNMSHDTAIKLYRSGHISKYARTIISRAEEYKKGE